ncbi:formate dehydrogenase accessory sulfurtransferase FdhD [Hyphococcus flavus]|uniref:Formate dehydrogenase accessory sulfurtransferase FdhD n=1 Tax=Hyphococcus flavus TaxID=1866326 RepID=A0AAF0CEI9_9PROT|nr:formate dehydrogenase accessory sulfurtransferase FdhD [Hyphococcus flavus]WDI31346.1 formate dehydrogenase accessory sulfurtransferase FdhD [Hyphococcus flavus]
MAKISTTGAPPPCERTVKVTNGNWSVPEETPVAFVYNRRNYAVMLATPSDMEDFAVGFSLTERVVDAVDEISAVDIHQSERGIELHLSIEPEKLERLDLRQQRRNLVGRAGCGVCGLENAETFFEPLPKVRNKTLTVDRKALSAALQALKDHQPLNTATRTVHGAAWADLNGAIVLAREDVGRHNALDKLLGALVRDNTDLQNGFVLMSSRCSYEIIEKSARVGVAAVASVSGPTAFAIRKAGEANISLYCREGESFVEVTQ